MKWLLFILILCTGNTLFAQQKFDVESWKSKGGYKILPRIQKIEGTLDSIITVNNANQMPNAFQRNLPAPKLVGNNGKAHNIYILAIDNMPMIKPDSTYSSNMPLVGFRRRKPTQ